MSALAALLVAACELLGPRAPVELSIDTWPKLSHESIEAARKLRSDIADGRHARKPDFKRAPLGYKQHLEHMRHCTSCWQRNYRDSLLRKAFNPLLGAAQLLIDDYTVHQHRCAVRVAEPPQKTLLDMRCPGTCDTNGSQYASNRATWNMFGMYGSVIKLQGKLHMWLGEVRLVCVLTLHLRPCAHGYGVTRVASHPRVLHVHPRAVSSLSRRLH